MCIRDRVYLFNILGEAYDGEYDVALRGDIGGGVFPYRALVDEGHRPLFSAVVDMHLIAGGEQVAGHAGSHYARADETEDLFIRHGITPIKLIILIIDHMHVEVRIAHFDAVFGVPVSYTHLEDAGAAGEGPLKAADPDMEGDVAVGGGLFIVIDRDADRGEGRQRDEVVLLEPLRPVYRIKGCLLYTSRCV